VRSSRASPNPRLQRTPLRAPLSRKPLGAGKLRRRCQGELQRVVLLGLALLAVEVLAGCGHERQARLTRNRPKDGDLAGQYLPTPASRTLISARGYPAVRSSIIIRADHTATIQNLPDMWLDGVGRSHEMLLNANGSWRLVESSRLLKKAILG
jgi:hypothetical protein